jgi:hypothetical protein
MLSRSLSSVLFFGFHEKISRNTLFEEDLIKSKSYILHGLVCNLLTRALATFRVRLKLPGQHEVVVALFFSSWSFSFTGELEHMVLLYFLPFFFLSIYFWIFRCSSQSSNDDGCETTVLEHVLEKRNSSCPLLLWLTSAAAARWRRRQGGCGGSRRRPRKRTNRTARTPLGGLPNFFLTPQCGVSRNIGTGL